MTQTISNSNNDIANAKKFLDQEVSIMDIAKIIMKAWKYSLAVLIFSLGLLFVSYFFITHYSNLFSSKNNYVSIYKAAESLPGKALIPLKSILEKIDLYHKNKIVLKYIKQKKWESLPFDITITISESSGLIVLKSDLSSHGQNKIENIKELHSQILEVVSDEDSIQLNHQKKNLERRLDSLNKSLSLLKNSNSLNAIELSAKYIEQITQIENNLSDLKTGKILQIAVENKDTRLNVHKLIFILAGILTCMLFALITPFFVELCKYKKESTRTPRPNSK